MIKAIIVEDEPRDREVLQKALAGYCTDVEIVAVAATISDAEQIIREKHAELLFLDVELPDGRAFDLLNNIKDFPLKIIFTTAHPEYAVKAFRFSAVDYLLKPVSFSELQNAVDKVRQGIELETEKSKIRFLLEGIRQNITLFKKIAIPDRKSVKFKLIDDIIFIEADGNYSLFKLAGNQELISCRNLKEYEDILAEYCFIRVSKSHLVNLNHVAEYRACGELLTSTGHVVTVGRHYRENFLEKMTQCKKRSPGG
jgi:two-component system LytT family response regulator